MGEKPKAGYEVVYDMGSGLKIARVPVSGMKEQDINARIMKGEMQDQLTANIKKRGQLESLPLLVDANGKLEIISGHHRIKSARAAGLQEIVAIVDDSGLSRSQIAAKQIAHNAISGFDDQSTLKEIVKMITDVDDMLETALPADYFSEMSEKAESLAAPAVRFDFKTVTFAFLTHQLDRLQDLTKAVAPSEFLGIAPRDQFEDFVSALNAVKKFDDVKSVGTAVYLMVQAAMEKLENAGVTEENRDEEWTSLTQLFGLGTVPATAAGVIREAIRKAEKNGIIDKKNRWHLIEYLCGEYLNAG